MMNSPETRALTGDETPQDEPVAFPAADGLLLAGRVYEPRDKATMTVLMLPGIGITQRLFRQVAPWFAERGARCLSFDYRGIGASATGAQALTSANLTRWARLDAVAAFEYAERQWPEPVVLFAHSFGGQLIGLAPTLARARAALLVGSQLGQPRYWDGWGRTKILGYWYCVLPVAATLWNPLPRWAGFGTRLPRGAAREWGRWGRSDEWLFSWHPEAAATFANFRSPVRAYVSSDDPIAPPRAAAALLECFASASVEKREITPQQVGLRSLGHVGLLREEQCIPVWQEMLDFLTLHASAAV
jgi:predicted alpha/beta hydrolase